MKKANTMNKYTRAIEDIVRTPSKAFSKVNFRQYITDKQAPAEKISEMSPAHIDLQSKVGASTSRQRTRFRTLANKLRLGYKTKNLLISGLITLLALLFSGTQIASAATSPSLGTASSFSVLAETNITNVPSSVISRDVGLSPASGSFIGLTDAEVGGTIYATDGLAPPAANATANPGLLTTAINDMTNVWSTGGGTGIDQPCTTSWSGTGPKDLTTVSPLGAGVYCADAFLLTGNLTLSGSGVWIFKSASTLTTAAGSTVTGGDGCNVWWRLVSAGSIIGSNSSLVGNILSGTSIAMQNGATLNGRALAQAAVTLDHNTITGPTSCTPTASSASASGSASGSSTAAPGLPNTGLGPQKSSHSWQAVSGVTAITAIMALAAFVALRKKYPSAE
jgi:hypothetical protein